MPVPHKFILSGGGTGGHIFPAIAIANALKAKCPDAEILFVGALGRMEMEKVPEAGYRIEGLNIAGFQRKKLWKNWSLLFKLFASLRSAKKLIRKFQPDVVIGTGGYASGPTLRSACGLGIPTLIQEQNSYPGITNKILGRKADRICIGFPGVEKFFPAGKVILTGNPVRKDIFLSAGSRSGARAAFGLTADSPVLLVIGGSLGARTINESLMQGMHLLEAAGIQVLWQTGKIMEREILEKVRKSGLKHIHPSAFIQRMDLAYAAADLVVSRAGALSVSEICGAGKAAILVPSPNVAEDHQTANAMTLVNKDAAVLVKDDEAVRKLVPQVMELIKDATRRKVLEEKASALAAPDAAERIADEVLKLVRTQ